MSDLCLTNSTSHESFCITRTQWVSRLHLTNSIMSHMSRLHLTNSMRQSIRHVHLKSSLRAHHLPRIQRVARIARTKPVHLANSMSGASIIPRTQTVNTSFASYELNECIIDISRTEWAVWIVCIPRTQRVNKSLVSSMSTSTSLTSCELNEPFQLFTSHELNQ